MFYVTGDTHGRFGKIKEFCEQTPTTKEDVMIILGDAGINFGDPIRDRLKKEILSSYPITIFAIHGNHEQRPYTIETYKEKLWRGGIVYYEEEFPDILFAKDGEIYSINGLDVIVIGGAYSIDKDYRLLFNYGWWEDEQPSDEIKQYVEKQLKERNWRIDVVLSHTVPLKYEPTEVFLPGVNQDTVDKNTEIWLGEIEARLQYGKWYAGHYHTEKKIDRLELMFNSILPFYAVKIQQ